jgi:hypothetical protein
MCRRDLWNDVSLVKYYWAEMRNLLLSRDHLCVDNSVGTVETSSKIGSSKMDPLSRTSVLMVIEETVETVVIVIDGNSLGEGARG